jgi:hypothetical protein
MAANNAEDCCGSKAFVLFPGKWAVTAESKPKALLVVLEYARIEALEYRMDSRLRGNDGLAVALVVILANAEDPCLEYRWIP